MDILKLKPVFKDYIWGGTRLRDDFGYECDIEPIAEGLSWTPASLPAIPAIFWHGGR